MNSRAPEYVPVFPQPLVTAHFPPLQCLCTWAVSPHMLGTVDKPFVLKIYYGMCPVPGHRTRAAIGTSIAERVGNGDGQGQREGRENQRRNQESGKRSRAERQRSASQDQGKDKSGGRRKRQEEEVAIKGEKL